MVRFADDTVSYTDTAADGTAWLDDDLAHLFDQAGPPAPPDIPAR
jgi:hypothetical protein